VVSSLKAYPKAAKGLLRIASGLNETIILPLIADKLF
jgi:hypothetical protein